MCTGWNIFWVSWIKYQLISLCLTAKGLITWKFKIYVACISLILGNVAWLHYPTIPSALGESRIVY